MRGERNRPQHLLAHAILGAAVSAATGNDALTGGISASSGEVTATLLSKCVYKVDDPSELTAEQKNTISNITTLAGVAIGSTTGEVTDAVNAGETAKVAVEDNGFLEVIMPETMSHVVNDPNKAKALKQQAEFRKITTTGVVVANTPQIGGLLLTAPSTTPSVGGAAVKGAATAAGMEYGSQKMNCLVCKSNYGPIAAQGAIGAATGAYGGAMNKATNSKPVSYMNLPNNLKNTTGNVNFINLTMMNQAGSKSVQKITDKDK